MDLTLLHVLAVLFVATLIRSAFGFGEALIAVPLLALRVPIKVAAPLAVLVSTVVAAMVVAQDWRHIHRRSAAWLVAATLLGIPLGLVLLRGGNERLVKAGLALVIALFSIYSLYGRGRMALARDHLGWMLGCGFVAGVLGGAYGMNGPPLVFYGAMRRWSAEPFRATLQAYFLPASAIGLVGYWLAGLWSAEVTRYFLFGLPVVFGGVLAGRVVNRRLAGDSFLTYVYVGLLGVAALLAAQALAA